MESGENGLIGLTVLKLVLLGKIWPTMTSKKDQKDVYTQSQITKVTPASMLMAGLSLMSIYILTIYIRKDYVLIQIAQVSTKMKDTLHPKCIVNYYTMSFYYVWILMLSFLGCSSYSASGQWEFLSDNYPDECCAGIKNVSLISWRIKNIWFRISRSFHLDNNI